MNTFIRIKRSLLSLLTIFCLASCDSGEDDLVNEIKENTMLNLDGKLVKSVGNNFSFSYDTNGKLISYKHYSTNYEVSIDPFVLQRNTSSSREVISFFMNSLGYVSRINEVSSAETKDGSFLDKRDYDLSYNKFGQMISMQVKHDYTEESGGVTFREKGTESYTIKYDGSVLNSIEFRIVFEEDEEEYGIYTFFYDTPYDNAFCQYTPAIAGAIFEDQTLVGLAYLGIFGKSTTALPSHYLFDNNNKSTCSYSFNPDGSLASVGSVRYTYVSQY